MHKEKEEVIYQIVYRFIKIILKNSSLDYGGRKLTQQSPHRVKVCRVYLVTLS